MKLEDMIHKCNVCGIQVKFLKIPQVYIHAEPRSIKNNFHNGTPDHNAEVSHEN